MGTPEITTSAVELMATVFPPVIYVVAGILVPGLTLLAGAPKLGKSWLAMNLAAAIAAGGVALGRIDAIAGDVLYLALEDPPRRIQERLRIVLEDQPAPAALHFATEWPLMHDGGASRCTDGSSNTRPRGPCSSTSWPRSGVAPTTERTATPPTTGR